MPKSKVKFELILLFHKGYTPRELIAFGFAKSTVHKYSKYYKIALEDYRRIVKK